MANVIKLRKGLNIQLAGKAAERKTRVGRCEEYALVPDDFTGVTPKLVVREGDEVKAGDALFIDKNCPRSALRLVREWQGGGSGSRRAAKGTLRESEGRQRAKIC